jgi:guanine deaminase
LAGGRITHFGPASRVLVELPAGIEVRDFGKEALISAGFIDTHVHFPQMPMIAAYGAQLLDWLNRYTFPAELKFADKDYARSVARTFLRENLRNGVTTSCVYCTVHPHSVDVLFEEAETLGLRLAAGKVLMDRNAPEALCDTPQTGYDQSKALIAKWQPRPAALCHHAATPDRVRGATGGRRRAVRGRRRLMQTHIAEIAGRGRLDQGCSPTGAAISTSTIITACAERAVFGHGIWLENPDCSACTSGAPSPLPDLEFLLGSGAFNLASAVKDGAAGAGRAGHRHRRRHFVLDPGDARCRL